MLQYNLKSFSLGVDQIQYFTATYPELELKMHSDITALLCRGTKMLNYSQADSQTVTN